jgi:hypothetical protein
MIGWTSGKAVEHAGRLAAHDCLKEPTVRIKARSLPKSSAGIVSIGWAELRSAGKSTPRNGGHEDAHATSVEVAKAFDRSQRM